MKYLILFIFTISLATFMSASAQDVTQIVALKATFTVDQKNTNVVNTEIAGSGWREGIDLFIVLSREQGGAAAYTYLAVTGKRNGVLGLMLRDGSFAPLENNRVKVQIPVKDLPLNAYHYVTVYARAISGVESGKLTVKIEK